MRLPVFFCALLACSKTPAKDDVAYKDPIGIEINDDFAVAIAADKDLDNAVVPELAVVFSAAAKACPDMHTQLADGKTTTLHAIVKNGAITATAEADPTSTCLAKALDGKSTPKVGNAKLLVQVQLKKQK